MDFRHLFLRMYTRISRQLLRDSEIMNNTKDTLSIVDNTLSQISFYLNAYVFRISSFLLPLTCLDYKREGLVKLKQHLKVFLFVSLMMEGLKCSQFSNDNVIDGQRNYFT